MPAFLNLILALLGGGALVASGGGSDDDAAPAEPVAKAKSPLKAVVAPPVEEDTPAMEDAAPVKEVPPAEKETDLPEEDAPPAEEERDPPAEDIPPAEEDPPVAEDPPADDEVPPPAEGVLPAEEEIDPPVKDDPPAKEDPPVAEDPPVEDVADPPVEEDAPQEDEPLSDAPDLPYSAYDLSWEGLTAQEQYMLELVNRARMDPEAEEVRTGEAVDSGVSTTPKQALAVDPVLSAAADNHSGDMLDRDFFAHTNPDGDGPTDRAQDEGWTGRGVWENISARWTSAGSVSDEQGWVDASHAGLWESDGHQFGMLQDSHTVVGIGIDWGEWSYPGPTYPTAMVVTEKFSNDSETYLTGVVIDDADNDNFYDIGEGQGGVQITIWNDEETHATSTWDSGGYSIALDPGTYNVLFEGGDLDTSFETTVTIGSQNEKLDVNEDDLGAAVMSMAPEDPGVEDEDSIAALFLSADASLEMAEQEAAAADSVEDTETDDLWVGF